ncbi:MAG: histidinol phosphatase [Candidatus Omnitrophica bacterium]|nr:histidinol phosphatase [Candidatus Omnitrophota bacterium]
MKFFPLPLLIVTLFVGLPSHAGTPGSSPGRKYSSIERMTLPRLEAAHKDVEALKEKRVEVSLKTDLTDYHGILHSHADDSSHTGGTRPEMLEAAKKVGVDVIFLSDHFRPPRDYMDSWRGMKDGVLFIPGSETHGFVVHPMESIMDKMDKDEKTIIEAVTEGDGLIFLSHVEARPDHSMEGLTGMEIYNRHADAMDDAPSMLALYQRLTDPEQAREMTEAIRLYPDEVLAAQQDYQQIYIAKWDAESLKQKVVGIAADDCHHNNIFLCKMVDDETVLVGTNVDKDEDMRKITAGMRPGIKEMTHGHQPGDILASFDLDPYDIFFNDVSTHILAKELTEESIRKALLSGHAYVSHDWMCDPTGFLVGVATKDEPKNLIAIMGDDLKYSSGQNLTAEFPIECQMKLRKNGQVVLEEQGRELVYPIEEPGVYRLEGWLTVDGEDRAWIYANPVYIR